MCVCLVWLIRPRRTPPPVDASLALKGSQSTDIPTAVTLLFHYMMTQNAMWINSNNLKSSEECQRQFALKQQSVHSVVTGSGSLRGESGSSNTTFLVRSRLQHVPVDRLFWHDVSDIVDHLQANNLTQHNLYNHDQKPVGKTLWSSRCRFFLFFFPVLDLKNSLKLF